MEATEAERQYEDELRFRAKRELRKRLRAVRGALPASAVAQRSSAIVERIASLPAWEAAGTVALFMSMPDEVQLGALIERARAQGKRVVLPVVLDGEAALEFRSPYEIDREHAFVTSPFGIAEPSHEAPRVAFDAIDLVVIPALAIDPRGHRIGYGAGFYDHTLVHMPRAMRVAVAFDFQLVAEVPIRKDDIAAQWIVTDTRVMRAEG